MARRVLGGTWDGAAGTRPRLLLECSPEHSPSMIADMLERQGYEVRICEGPDRRHVCPLLEHGSCGLVSGADVVVNLLTGPDPESRQVLGAISTERRPPAIVTEMPRPEVERRDRDDDWDFNRAQVKIVGTPASTASVLQAIRDAIDERNEPVPVWGDGFC